MRKCLFCHRRNLTREHLWPAWVSRLFEADGRQGRYLALTGEYAVTNHWEAASVNHRVRLICAQCNNGWMSKLEELVIPNLEPLITGEQPRALSLDDQASIVMWATKMAMLSEHASKFNKHPRFFSDADHLSFRETLTPPAGVYIWVAVAGESRQTTYLSVQNFLGENQQGDTGGHIQVSTGIVGSLVFQVYGSKGPTPTLALAAVDGSEWGSYAQRVWPDRLGLQLAW